MNINLSHPTRSLGSLAGLLIVSAVLPVAANAATLDILATTSNTTDTFIRYGNAGSQANTVQNSTNLILVGDTSTLGDDIRGLLSFDLSSYTELTGATINSVSLTFTINDSDETAAGKSANQTITLNLYQTSSFVEGQATWNSSSTGVAWTTPGGDLNALLASTTGNPGVDTQGTKISFSSSGLNTAISDTISGSGVIDFLLAIDSNDVDAVRSIFRLTSNSPVLSGGVTADFVPTLSIDYTIPEPSTFAMMAGLTALGVMVIRRRRR